jgi:uncharacterized protein (DUF302 family)/uncharacterized membrane protein YidH (DUF202 family)
VEPHPKASLADYFAAERTFLAWIRTGLALMGFGFVVARFGLFLQEFQLMQHLAGVPSHQLSLWFGTAMILLGVVVNIFSAARHVRLVAQFNRGEIPQNYSARAAYVAVFLAIVGLAMAIYLAFLRNSPSAAIIQTSGAHAAIGTVDPAQSKEFSMSSTANALANGLISIPSNHSVDDTVFKLKSILDAKHVTIFALVDHSGEAQKAGFTMRPTKLFIFGNPKGGTPVMLAAPTSAIDLPLKILIWEDAQSKVWVSYNSLPYLQQRHSIPADVLANLAVVDALAAQAAA